MLLYLFLAKTLRYRRISQLQAQYGSTAAEFANLDYKGAQTIIGQMGLYEFPWIFLAGKDFAFLRAFAIPGISKVSVAAKEMVSRVGKRYADTTVLVGEFLVNDIDSERACIAINRMNWIHSRYRGQIKMDQMVYTLCLLTCEALQWIDRYDWRQTTALEKHASWVFWNEVGKRMGLTDVPESFEACAEFIETFEKQHMEPSQDNAVIAKGVFALYASTVPSFLAPVVRAVLVAFMDTRLSGAFKLAPPSTNLFRSFLCFLLALRKYCVRHLMLPRYSTLQVFGEENSAGYRPMLFWEIEPWYVASSQQCNWFYRTYIRFFRLPVAGDAKFRPEGYKLQEIGPKHLEGKGGEEVMSFVKKGGASSFSTFGQFEDVIYKRGGCPMKAGIDSSSLKGTCPLSHSETAREAQLKKGTHDGPLGASFSTPTSQVAHVLKVAFPMASEL
ncbi:67 kDa myosin-cross-reactive antigen family [Pyrenophora seminiperda CCB06]|uniref:67 kDa myosin-cross-reactive antigen family n=1 Tax=Pyrenophora seminiperda CCB06 TaxID=1302712 RepID=A0A3M7LVA5_9PLEO|nr:67 kDa myosin-cross-reactive antigen family [Pyrenophora seminiperda CCB06]